MLDDIELFYRIVFFVWRDIFATFMVSFPRFPIPLSPLMCVTLSPALFNSRHVGPKQFLSF